MSELENLSISHVVNLKRWFDRYVDNIVKNNPDKKENLELKRIHTHNVCKESLKIMQNYRKNQQCRLVSFIIALFHDLGRFEQYAVFSTFNDKISTNHADLSIKIITENDLLKNINEYTKDIIVKAIENHNKAKMQRYDDYKINFLSKVIRDADKIDIYRIITQNYLSQNPNDSINLGLKNSDLITDDVYKKILNKTSPFYEDLNTIVDLKILHLSWVFDINFTYTLQKIKKEAYLEKIFSTMPKNSYTQLIFTIVNDYINKKLKTNS